MPYTVISAWCLRDLCFVMTKKANSTTLSANTNIFDMDLFDTENKLK